MTGEIQLQPVDPRELREIRRTAMNFRDNGPPDCWENETVLRLLAEIDRLSYMWWRGGPDDLITGEWASDGHQHTIVNGSHACICDAFWYPPPAESWTLPDGGG